MVFQSLLKNSSGKNRLWLGAPEAEAEALPTSRMSLFDVYEDHHGLLNQLTHEKFIVIGRKGSGKSAFAEYVSGLAQENSDLFCAFIRQGEMNLERIVQIGAESNYSIERENLFKWLIYTNLLSLFTKNHSVENNRDYDLLREFLNKNSGYINIKDSEIKELVKKYGFEVSVEQFKRFMRTKFDTHVEVKEGRAPFYKLLPHLEKVIIRVLASKENIENGNSHVIFFDDLDIGFSTKEQKSIDSIVDLLRVCKAVNNEVFAKNNIQAKVIILLRDDIEKFLAGIAADTAKLFSSYATRINWYQDEYAYTHYEDTLYLKKFINKRISQALRNAIITPVNTDPWMSLINADFSPKSSFKYIVDHTLFRPRDLLLMFKPLENGAYNIPLSRHEVNSLIGQFADELAKEIKSELSAFYDRYQIENIFDALAEITKTQDCYYGMAVSLISQYCENVDPHHLLNDLFERSMIGCRSDQHTQFVKYKYRESLTSPDALKLDTEGIIAVHQGLKIYLSKR